METVPTEKRRKVSSSSAETDSNRNNSIADKRGSSELQATGVRRKQTETETPEEDKKVWSTECYCCLAKGSVESCAKVYI